MAWQDEYLTQITDCEKRESRLSDWDRGFIESLHSQIEKDKVPTAKQIERLDIIWNRATARG
jgi:hypothetical protein